jgi:hypothetical protein
MVMVFPDYIKAQARFQFKIAAQNGICVNMLIYDCAHIICQAKKPSDPSRKRIVDEPLKYWARFNLSLDKLLGAVINMSHAGVRR